MGEKTATGDENASHGRLFLPSLVFSNFSTGALPLLVSLLLIDIGATFNLSEGVTGQMSTSYYGAAVVFALLMGALSIRYGHRKLLLAGLLLTAVSAIGCYLAPEFQTMTACYALSGVGVPMVLPMAVTLVGEHFPIRRRASILGFVVAGASLVYFVGAPWIAYVANSSGWRLAILAFPIPVSLAGFALAWVGLRSIQNSSHHSDDGRSYKRGFGEVLSNRSALACLIGNFFRSSSFAAILLYSASFGRQTFSHSRGTASIVMLSAALCYTLGSLTCGMMVAKFGRKKSTVLSALLAGAFTIAFVFAPHELLYVAALFTGCWFFGTGASSAQSLSLEQVPKLRGTMMSLDSAALNLGSAVGAAVGGLVLTAYGYGGLGTILGTMGLAAALVFGIFARDPTRS